MKVGLSEPLQRLLASRDQPSASGLPLLNEVAQMHFVPTRVPGRDCRLTAEQKRMIPSSSGTGRRLAGFRGQVWTCTASPKLSRRSSASATTRIMSGGFAQATAVDGSDADSPGHPARRTGYQTVACQGLARVAKAGVA